MSRLQEKYKKLREHADGYGGVFTSRHAESFGFSKENLSKKIKTGVFERISYGIYKFKDSFDQGLESAGVALLWTRNDVGEILGAISHDTAFWLWSLTDYTCNEIHLSVPVGFRRRSAVPPRVVLHYGLPTSVNDVCSISKCQRITPVWRTLKDCYTAKSVGLEFITEGYFRARQDFLISKEDIQDISGLDGEGSALFEKLEQKINAMRRK
jgi:predicted transcriptional regulator of viral defense system